MFGNLWKLLRGFKATPALMERGRAGELQAANFLQEKGMRIVDRNWRCSMGELDIIATEGEVFVFVEVKSAGKTSAFRPERRVNREKQKRIKRLAHAFLKSRRIDCPIRYDIVTVIWDDGNIKLEHYRNAFV